MRRSRRDSDAACITENSDESGELNVGEMAALRVEEPRGREEVQQPLMTDLPVM